MEVGFMSEGELFDRTSYFHRYHDLVREVQFAEQMGFDVFACSEQHFMHGATISSPECLFSHLIPLTTKIRFLYAVVLTPFKINHPLRVAERVAMQDVLSGGRIELGTGRVNTTLTIKAFEVDADQTRAQWKEALDVIRLAFTEEPFGFSGKFFNIPHRYLVPKPIQQPHPPLSVAATSPEMQVTAAQEGLAVMVSSSFFGLDWLRILSEKYWDTVESLNNRNGTKQFGFMPLLYTYCAETDAEARRVGAEALRRTAEFSLQGYSRLAHNYASYGYMMKADEAQKRINDIDWLIEESGAVICGSPETCVKQIERIRQLRATRVLLRIDGFGHEKVMRSLELIGRHVLPYVKTGLGRPPDAMAGVKR